MGRKWTAEERERRAREKAEMAARYPYGRLDEISDQWGIILEFEEGCHDLTVMVRGDVFDGPDPRGWRTTHVFPKVLRDYPDFIHALVARYNGEVRDHNVRAIRVLPLDPIAEVKV